MLSPGFSGVSDFRHGKARHFRTGPISCVRIDFSMPKPPSGPPIPQLQPIVRLLESDAKRHDAESIPRAARIRRRAACRAATETQREEISRSGMGAAYRRWGTP